MGDTDTVHRLSPPVMTTVTSLTTPLDAASEVPADDGITPHPTFIGRDEYVGMRVKALIERKLMEASERKQKRKIDNEKEEEAESKIKKKRRKVTHKKRKRKIDKEKEEEINKTTKKKRRKVKTSFTHKKRMRKPPLTLEQKVIKRKKLTAHPDAKCKFTRAAVARMPVKKDSYTNIPIHPEFAKVFESEEFKYMLKNKTLTSRRRNPVNVCPTKYHRMTNAEYVEYMRAYGESDGFDLPCQPFTHYNPGMQSHYYLQLNESGAEMLAKYSKFALKYYNRKNGTDYKLIRLDKANHASCCAAFYNITFIAESPSSPEEGTKYFQASVHMDIKGNIEILLCRIRTKTNEKHFF